MKKESSKPLLSFFCLPLLFARLPNFHFVLPALNNPGQENLFKKFFKKIKRYKFKLENVKKEKVTFNSLRSRDL